MKLKVKKTSTYAKKRNWPTYPRKHATYTTSPTMLTLHPMLAQIDRDKITGNFHVQVCFRNVDLHCIGIFLLQARSKQHFTVYFPAKRWLCTLWQNCTSNFLAQCCLTTCLNNFGWMIFLCNTSSLSGNITKGFHLSNVCPKSIKTIFIKIVSNAMLFAASKATLSKIFPV